ncbi:MAG TPA: hypothetical protein VHC22_00715 [Pirellulales bacterium]|nr:hypothetical protein [Pirellulales bacterium]
MTHDSFLERYLSNSGREERAISEFEEEEVACAPHMAPEELLRQSPPKAGPTPGGAQLRKHLKDREAQSTIVRMVNHLKRQVDSLESRLAKSESSESTLDDIEAILRLTQSLFPGEVKIETSVDPEYPDSPSIVFHVVNTADLSIQAVLDRELQWQREIGRIAPESRDRLRLFVD